jgi:tetratricopeptide (TPR) repeat protein
MESGWNDSWTWTKWLLVLAATLGACGRPQPQAARQPVAVRLVAIPEHAPPDASGTPGGQLWHYMVTNLPAGSGYTRGDMLALYALRPGTNDEEPVGFGHVVEAREHSLLFAAAYVDIDHQAVPLRLGPVPGGHHFGKQLGQVVDHAKERRARIDMGRDHGVVPGDLYTVLGPAVGAAGVSGRSLGRAPVGLLQVIEVQDMFALARIETGQGPAGAHVAHAGHDARLHRTEPGVRLLVTRFLGDAGQAFALQLHAVLRTEIGGDSEVRGDVTVRYHDEAIEENDASHERARSLGMAYGEDIVVWGSVRRVDDHVAVAAQATFTDPERMDVPGREWASDQMLAASLLDDRGNAVSRRIGSLAAYLVGLSYFFDHETENGGWARAAYHLARVSEQGEPEDALTARVALFYCYQRTGQWARAETVARQVEADGTRARDERRKAHGLYMRAMLARNTGRLDEAYALARQSADIDRMHGNARDAAVAMGLIADIYHSHGDLDEALRIRLEEQLPVFQNPGDIRERTVTMGQIADIYYHRSRCKGGTGRVRCRTGQIADTDYHRRDLDEALRIHEEQLPGYERFGRILDHVVTMDQTADIDHSPGDLDEALRIHRDEELPVYQTLDNLRDRAVIMGKIADIYYDRGNLDEALRIRRDEELPVFQKLGDLRGQAVTLGKIADIYYRRGNRDEALRIRRDEELPVYQTLGDIRSRAITMGKIADIYYDDNDLDEALRIRLEEELPVFQALGDIRSHAVTMGKIADIYYRRRNFDEALRIRRDELLPVFQKLGDIRSRAITMGKIADIYYRRDNFDEALRIRRNEELPVLQALDDRREILVSQVCIAAYHLARNRPGDRAEAQRLLTVALRAAEEMKLPEAEQIRAIMNHNHL